MTILAAIALFTVGLTTGLVVRRSRSVVRETDPREVVERAKVCRAVYLAGENKGAICGNVVHMCMADLCPRCCTNCCWCADGKKARLATANERTLLELKRAEEEAQAKRLKALEGDLS